MAKNSGNKIEKRSTKAELLKKPIEVLAEYIIYLENEWFKFNGETKTLKKTAPKLEKPKIKVIEPKTGKKKYDLKSSWIEKLIFILKENGKPMCFEEIKSQFLFLEPEIKFQWSNLNNQISQILYRASAAKEINKRKLKGGNTYFIE